MQPVRFYFPKGACRHRVLRALSGHWPVLEAVVRQEHANKQAAARVPELGFWVERLQSR